MGGISHLVQVGDHDQDSLYDLTINNMEPEAIINGNKDKERKPSKIDIPFVVSIGNNGLAMMMRG